MQKFHYQCVNCGKEYPAGGIQYLCPSCESGNTPDAPPKGVLKTVYDYNKLRKNIAPGELFKNLSQNAFLDLLPVNSPESFGPLNVGNTPAYHWQQKSKNGTYQLILKDDSHNPTFSFKDRASALVSAFAKENQINTIVAASTGNAGSSLAGICASQSQKAVIFVPATAPKAKLLQIMLYGATIVPVDGNYDAAFDFSLQATKEYGLYNRNTAYNPLTIEGKKTAAFELFRQCGMQAPDMIFVSVGDGVILSGIYKGFEDLLMLGIIEKMPRIVAVQAEGSNSIIRNLHSEVFEPSTAQTIADSISVVIPRNFYMAKDFLLKYNGEGIAVPDDAILNASLKLTRNFGIFTEPAGAAAFAGYLKYCETNPPENGSKIAVLLTGSGLKDLNAVSSLVTLPEAIEPSKEALRKISVLIH